MLLGSLHLNNNQQERPSLPSQKSSYCEIKEKYNEGGVYSILLALLNRGNDKRTQIEFLVDLSGLKYYSMVYISVLPIYDNMMHKDKLKKRHKVGIKEIRPTYGHHNGRVVQPQL